MREREGTGVQARVRGRGCARQWACSTVVRRQGHGCAQRYKVKARRRCRSMRAGANVEATKAPGWADAKQRDREAADRRDRETRVHSLFQTHRYSMQGYELAGM